MGLRVTIGESGNLKKLKGIDGDLKYNLFGGNISGIGSKDVRYDLFSGKVTDIGNTKIEYDMFSGKVTKVLGNDVEINVE